MTTLVTHDGIFHADDIFATAVLKKVFGEVRIVRTRRAPTSKSKIIIYDVGLEYDPEQDKFDHHQVSKPYDLARPSGVPYAAFGLVWKKYGRDLCPDVTFLESTPASLKLQPADIVDITLVQAVDCLDTGSIQLPSNTPLAMVSGAISQFLPTYEEESPEALAISFDKAVAFATTILENSIRHAQASARAKDQVYQHLLNRPNPSYLVLDKACAWGEVVKACSNPGDIAEQLLYVVFPASDGRWRLQCVQGTQPFSTRKALPLSWAGTRPQDLVTITGVSDASFCHNGRFIAGAASKEGAIKLLELALSEPV
jgi:uncharacterized UPF0160 family protein